MEVKVDEQAEYAQAVENERPLHPLREVTAAMQRASGVGHTRHKLDLREKNEKKTTTMKLG